MTTRERIFVICLALGLAGCGARPPGSIPHDPATRRDSIIEAAVRLGRMVHLLDDVARPNGSLPPTLAPLFRAHLSVVQETDLWGTPIRYTPSGLRYELRAAGPDRQFHTSDDIVSLAQLGRVLPCETRHGLGSLKFEEFAPPCSGDVLVLPLCPPGKPFVEQREIGRDGRDSILATGQNMVGFARMIDGYARTMGALPSNLRQVVSNRDLLDVWGRQLHYEQQGRQFQIRSAGGDGMFGTMDDIIVESTLGRTVRCVFSLGAEQLSCADPPPICPEGAISSGL